MKKYIIVIVILLILNIVLFKYLLISKEYTIPFKYTEENDYILFQIQDINLNTTEEFIFDNYFKILSFREIPYKYSFNDNSLLITIEDNVYNFIYQIIEPKVIEKVVYLVDEKENIANKNINNRKQEEFNKQINEEYTYVDDSYFEYNVDTDLNIIRNDLMNNIHSSSKVSIDYSNLNTSCIGQYSVFYITNIEKIEIIIEIK